MQDSMKPRRRAVNLIVLLALLFPISVCAQNWAWTVETVAPNGKQASLAVDSHGNLHVSYVSEEEGVKYAFRQKGTSRWYSMTLGGTRGFSEAYTRIAVDKDDNPYICHTVGVLVYSYFDGKKWQTQEVSPNSGSVQYSCAVAIADDGTPHLVWYQYGNPDGSNYLHIKYAVLKDNAWLARTVDFATQTGKWHSIALNAKGNPHLSYDAYVEGALKYAYWDGNKWTITTVDSRALNKKGAYDRGMGSSLALSPDGTPEISYYDDNSLRYARLEGGRWKIQTVEEVNPTGSWLGFRSTLVLDQDGLPHISYEDGGTLKHAYWDGTRWRIQVIAPSGPNRSRYHSTAIGKDGALYVVYRDPFDASLKLAVGHSTPESQKAAREKP